MTVTIGRRELLAALGGVVAAWPLVARAQRGAMPMIGLVSAGSHEPNAKWIAAVRQGLTETGHVEGRNVTIEYRFAEGKYDQLPAMAIDLVQRKTALIFAAFFLWRSQPKPPLRQFQSSS